MPFSKETNIFLLYNFFPPKWKVLKLLGKISADIWTTCSAEVIIRGARLKLIKEEIKEILVLGSERAITDYDFTLSSLCCLEVSFSQQLFN